MPLARSAFTTVRNLDPGFVTAKVGLLVVELLEHRKDAALALEAEIFAQEPAALRPVEEQSKSVRPLAQALEELGLRFDQGRLMPSKPP